MAQKNNDDSNLPSRSDSDDVRRRNGPEGLDLAAGVVNRERAELREQTSEPQPSGSSDKPPRREENPYSFKRFLNQDRGGGARRKEYSPDGTPVLHNTSEMSSSILPDFVQDHLVVEQCYLSSSPAHHAPLPFDLPLPADERVETVPQSLPDFLSDGPIHSQRGGNEASSYLVTSGASNGIPSPGPSPRSEVERLQREVDNLRRQLSERNRRVEMLEGELACMHSRDVRETSSLELALQQVEANLRQCSKRLASAESTVSKLKTENKLLRSDIQLLQEGGGAAGIHGSHTQPRNTRLALDLRNAASAAEIHVRSLLSGIDNLRMLAASVEDRAQLYDYDDCADAASGPAL